VLGDVGQPDHLRVVDQQSEQASSFGEVTHPGPLLGADTDVDELRQSATSAQHPQRAVAGIDQLHGGLHDALQSGIQFQPSTDRDVCIEQPLQPVPGLDDLGKAVLDFLEQLVQPQPGQPSRQRSASGVARR